MFESAARWDGERFSTCGSEAGLDLTPGYYLALACDDAGALWVGGAARLWQR